MNKLIIYWMFLINSEIIVKDDTIKSDDSKFINSILLPALIATSGYLAKSIYDIYLEKRRKRIQNIEDKLKLFYWPILIRLEKDNAIWKIVLSKKKDSGSLEYQIADHIEENIILKNHHEILDIINNYAYLAEPTVALRQEIDSYIKNVTIYIALRKSGDNTKFPIEFDASWPIHFYPIIKERTDYYQKRLKSKSS